VLGIVIGLVCISIAGLFVAAIGNWALSARLTMLVAVIGFYVSSVFQNCLEASTAKAFPAFAQQLYASPIDATGKAVCSS
jgi:hypothetical protein